MCPGAKIAERSRQRWIAAQFVAQFFIEQEQVEGRGDPRLYLVDAAGIGLESDEVLHLVEPVEIGLQPTDEPARDTVFVQHAEEGVQVVAPRRQLVQDDEVILRDIAVEFADEGRFYLIVFIAGYALFEGADIRVGGMGEDEDFLAGIEHVHKDFLDVVLEGGFSRDAPQDEPEALYAGLVGVQDDLLRLEELLLGDGQGELLYQAGGIAVYLIDRQAGRAPGAIVGADIRLYAELVA